MTHRLATIIHVTDRQTATDRRHAVPIARLANKMAIMVTVCMIIIVCC